MTTTYESLLGDLIADLEDTLEAMENSSSYKEILSQIEDIEETVKGSRDLMESRRELDNKASDGK